MTNRLLQIFVDNTNEFFVKGPSGPGRMLFSCGRAGTVPEGVASFFLL